MAHFHAKLIIGSGLADCTVAIHPAPALLESVTIADHITGMDLTQSPFRLEGGSGDTCDARVAATSARAKWRGRPSEGQLRGLGVSDVPLPEIQRVLKQGPTAGYPTPTHTRLAA